MTLPGDRIPEEALPDHPNHVPAQDADVLPVFCRHSVKWSWDGDEGGYRCADEDHYDGPLPTLPGAIDPSCQPTYAHPPRDNPRVQAALDAEDVLAQRDAIKAAVEEARRAW